NCTFPGAIASSPPQLLAFVNYERFFDNVYWNTTKPIGFGDYVGGFQLQTVSLEGLRSKVDPCGAGAVGVTTVPLSFQQWTSQLSEDQGSIIRDPAFTRPYYPYDDFSLRFGSPGAGFVPFDSREAGRVFSFPRPPAVAPTFVTAPLDPRWGF
ncbi:MAG: hypothetical protein JO090_14315, partial [Rhizobacter sp.]|nr:hypothetical protein [Rhizobacter sp.]